MNLTQSFSIAAWIVIFGVLSTWFYLKQGVGQVEVDLPDIPRFSIVAVEEVSDNDLLAQAEQAFSAGRIIQPAGASALYFYQSMLESDTESEDGRRGVRRVVNYLINSAESALAQQDWAAARTNAREAIKIDKGNRSARSVLSRVDRSERVAELAAVAITHVAAGRLTRPDGKNALATYREILSLDPTNASAQQGIESIAQRLATIAQTEAFAENHERARELIALAKEIAPDAAGIKQTEQLTLQWTDMVKDQAVKEDLLAAAQAMQAGHLVADMSPSGVGALDHYRSVLLKDPESAAAQKGIDILVDSLVDRAWSAAANDDIDLTRQLVGYAQDAGSDEAALADIGLELDFLERRERARQGMFDKVLPIRELTVRRQSQPQLPRGVDSGYVELLFTVDEEGDVADVQVVSVSDEVLVDAAVSAVQRWRFEPITERGRPLPVRSGVRFSFQS